MKAYILLEDGTILAGESFGAKTTVCGEIVFNTGMTGYQEILTDPSYGGQVVSMTYPLIGNYGVNGEDVESSQIQVSGFIVKEYSEIPNHWQSQKTIDTYLKENNIPGIYGVDTRKLTKIIRNNGAMNCLITTELITEKHINMLKKYQFPKNIVSKVSIKSIQKYAGTGLKIALVDLGTKKGIIKQFQNLNCDITVFPYDVTSDTILKGDFNVVFFSNGPGDPEDAVEAISLAKDLLGKKILWGICLGHQILALALGAKTYKLKFGHRGANHPVIELETNKVFMSSQNHGYAVDKASCSGEIQITYLNVNDDTVEGISHNTYHVKSVQFHPEEGPGPEDAHYIFKKWLETVQL